MPQSFLSTVGAVALLLASAVLLSSCAFTSRVLSVHPLDRSVPGLRAALNETADGGTLRVFLVHGMSNHPYGPKDKFSGIFGEDAACYKTLLEKMEDPAWRSAHEGEFIKAIEGSQFEPLITKLAGTLGLKPEGKARLKWFAGKSEPKLIGYQLQRPFRGIVDGKERRMCFYVTSWAHACLNVKTDLAKADDYTEREYPVGNKWVKDGLVTWGLMDAALYVGSDRQRMERAVALGLASMWEDAAHASGAAEVAKRDRFAFVSQSLGSIICLNTLTRVTQEEVAALGLPAERLGKEAIAAMFKHEPPLHMLANQVPLLSDAVDDSRAGVKAGVGAGPPDAAEMLRSPQAEALNSFAEALSQITPSLKRFAPLEKGGSQEYHLNVIAYTDPADLLSFKIRQCDLQSEGRVKIILTNVLVRNPAFGSRLLLSNPLAAHGNFDKSPAVIRLMAEGGR